MDQIVSEALTIYNNAITANWWQTTDPKADKIIVLTMQIEKLVEMKTKLVANLTWAPLQNRSSSRL